MQNFILPQTIAALLLAAALLAPPALADSKKPSEKKPEASAKKNEKDTPAANAIPFVLKPDAEFQAKAEALRQQALLRYTPAAPAPLPGEQRGGSMRLDGETSTPTNGMVNRGVPVGQGVFRVTAGEALNRLNKRSEPLTPELRTNLRYLIKILALIQRETGRPIKLVSGYRSPAYNEDVGGAKQSQHMQGKAVDFLLKDMSPRDTAALIEKLIAQGRLPEGGLGTYPTWVHYDFRGNHARWSED